MSRKSRENKLNENMDKMNQTFENLNKNLEGVVSKMNSISKASKDIANTQDKINNYIDSQTQQLARQNELANDKQKNEEKARKRNIANARENYRNFISNQEKSYKTEKPIIKSLSDFYNYKNERKKDARLQKELGKARKEAIEYIRNHKDIYTDSEGRYTQEAYAKMQEKITKHMEKSSKEFNEGASKIKVAAESFVTGLGSQLWSLIKNVFGVVYNTAKEGMNRQVSAYEDTFEGISVRNGTTRSQYYDTQTTISDTLKSLDLNENIGASEVQRMLSTLATNGMAIDLSDEESRAKTVANAIDTVLTNKIVPYLDVSSESIQQFASNNQNLLKQVRGIGATTMEISGSAVFATKHLQEMIEELSPMAQQAEQELGLQYAKATQQYESLRAQGMSDMEIGELYKTAASVYLDPYSALTSKDIVKSMSVANAISSGGDLRNFGDVNTSFLSSALTVGSWVPSGRLSPLFAGAMPTSISSTTLSDISNNKYDLQKIIEDGNRAANEVLENAQDKTDDYVNDVNQTVSQLRKNTLENLTTELAKVKEKLGILGDTIEKAIEGLGSFITSWLLSNIVGGAIGTGIGNLSSGLLATGGGILIGLAAVTAITAAVVSAMKQKAIEENQNDKSKSSMEARKMATETGISVGEASLNMAGSNIYNSAENWLGNKFDNGQAAELFGADYGYIDSIYRGVNESDFTQTLDKATNSGDTLKYNKAKIGKAIMYGLGQDNKTILSNVAKAWMIGLYSQGYLGDNANIYNALSDTLNIGSFTPDEASILQLLSGPSALTRKQFNDTVELMRNADMWLWNEIGQWIMPNENDYNKALNINGLNEDTKSFLSSHRYGLAEVPYDEYPSLLHEGEAVLTASTANELRNLLDEYRSNNQSIITIDATLQNQTVQLVNKLDEIISTINNLNSGNSITSTSSLDQQHARNRLLSSMTHMTNTKDALR